MKGKPFSCLLNERFMKNDIIQEVLIYWKSLRQGRLALKPYEIDGLLVEDQHPFTQGTKKATSTKPPFLRII